MSYKLCKVQGKSNIGWLCELRGKIEIVQVHILCVTDCFYSSVTYGFILIPFHVNRTGLLDKKSRMKLLTKLTLTGTEISDISLRYLTQYLSQLSVLNVSRCWKLTDAGLAMLAGPESKTVETLTSINLSACQAISNQVRFEDDIVRLTISEFRKRPKII